MEAGSAYVIWLNFVFKSFREYVNGRAKKVRLFLRNTCIWKQVQQKFYGTILCPDLLIEQRKCSRQGKLDEILFSFNYREAGSANVTW